VLTAYSNCPFVRATIVSVMTAVIKAITKESLFFSLPSAQQMHHMQKNKRQLSLVSVEALVSAKLLVVVEALVVARPLVNTEALVVAKPLVIAKAPVSVRPLVVVRPLVNKESLVVAKALVSTKPLVEQLSLLPL
jgi:hypothetical protein